MRSCGVAVTGVMLGFFMMAGPVLAQDNKTAPAPQIYNGSPGSGNQVKPIFLQGTAQQPTGMQTTTPYTSDSQTSNGAMTEADYKALADKIEAEDNKVHADRVAQIQAQYDATLAQQEAANAAAAQQRAAQSGGVGADRSAAAQKDQANPYAGKTVVFTGAKKANSDKPVRLFNVK
jgi:hypothetical protein